MGVGDCKQIKMRRIKFQILLCTKIWKKTTVSVAGRRAK